MASALPELEGVAWRRRTDERSLRLRERLSAAFIGLYVAPLLVVAVVLVLIEPLLAPVALVGLFLAWVIPELFANRGAGVVRVSRRRGGEPERVAQGLLGDLLGHEERDLQRRTGLALERGRMGVWLVGEAGALLVRPGGRTVHAFCVRVADADLPSSDRIAHLLLALREDEQGFATVANHAFAGATWRLRRRVPSIRKPALRAAVQASRAASAADGSAPSRSTYHSPVSS